MIQYYESKGLQNAEVHYIKKLMGADRILHKTYAYLQGKVKGEYDTQKLEQRNNEIEKSLHRRKYNDFISVSVIATLFLIIILLIVRYLKSKKEIRRKYEELIEKLEVSKKKKSLSGEENGLAISKSAEDTVLGQLGRFEEGKKFRDKDLTLTKLAGQFNTNPRYLSEIIAKHRHKNFSNYLNGLKVEHIA